MAERSPGRGRGLLKAVTGPFGPGRRRSDRRSDRHLATYTGPDRRRGERRRRATRGVLFAAFTLAGVAPWTMVRPEPRGVVNVREADFRLPSKESRYDHLIAEAASTYDV